MLSDLVNDPAVAWTESLSRLYKLTRKVNDLGGMTRVSRAWDSATRTLFAAELARVIAILTAWERELSGKPADA